MKKIKKSKSYIAITVLILMLVLVAITYLFAQVIYGDLAIARNNKASTVAFALAEAGVQDAIYKIKYDSDYRDPFIYGDPGNQIPFSSPSALINNGTYDVTVDFIDEGLANVTAVGNYQMGTKIARREIKTSIAQSVDNPAYDDDAAIFISNSGPTNSGKLYLNHTDIDIFGGGLISGGDLDLNQSRIYSERSIQYKGELDSHATNLKCNCYITAAPDPQTVPPTPQCSAAPACTPTHVGSVDSIPAIDFDSTSLGSYKSKAIVQGQYFASQTAFKTYLGGNTSVSGIVYVDVGSSGTLDFGTLLSSTEPLTVNGILVSSYNIEVPNNRGLVINHTSGQPSGVVAKHDFNTATGAIFTGEGLIYAGNLIETNHPIFTVVGGIFARDISINQGLLNITFDKTLINDSLPPNPEDTPVIERTYWEEEY